jgi:hypothetical protein
MQVENEIEWLITTLFTKKLVPAKFSFYVPQTVIMRDKIPDQWYFSCRENDKFIILQKSVLKTSLKNIIKEWSDEEGLLKCLAQNYTFQ